MKSKMLGVISLICLIVTVLWLILYIVGLRSAGPMDTFDQVLAYVAKLDVMFYLTYVNATLITLGVTLLFAGLYVYCKSTSSVWSMMGLVFVPVYCVFNLFTYLSQITIVPRLLDFEKVAKYQAVPSLLLRQMTQQWSGSTVAVFNNMAYAVLGIPSIIFGLILFKRSKSMRLPGALLALNGVACIIGMIGVVSENRLIAMGSVVGGVLFLLALIPLSVTLLRENR